MKLTKHRKEIFHLFENESNKVFSVDDISNKMKETSIDLSTIYRNINTLLEANYLGKTIIDNIPYYYLKNDKHLHLAVCKKCQSFFSIDCILHQILESSDIEEKMTITDHELLLVGVCKECQLSS